MSIITKDIIVPKIVIKDWFAPVPRPIAIIKNKKISSSGSLMAALNLTIDKAPTNPRDNAIEFFTTIIIKQVVSARTMKLLEKFLLFERLVEHFK